MIICHTKKQKQTIHTMGMPKRLKLMTPGERERERERERECGRESERERE